MKKIESILCLVSCFYGHYLYALTQTPQQLRSTAPVDKQNLSSPENKKIRTQAFGDNLTINAGHTLSADTINATSGGSVTFNNSIATTNNVALPTTASSSAGVMTINSNPFLHAYGTDNTFIGKSAGNFSLSGGDNTAVGYKSLNANTSGTQNTSIGSKTLQSTSGTGNICLGYNAGSSYTSSESNNILIGNTGTASESNQIKIGTTSNQTACSIAGITGVTVVGSAVFVTTGNQLGVLLSSQKYKKDINDMNEASAQLMQLRPVTFKYKNQPADAPLEYGLIAEEVEKVFPELVNYDKDDQPESVKYHALPALLLNEYQQQQKTLDMLDSNVNEHTKQLDTHDQQLFEIIDRLIQLEKNSQRQ